MPMRKLLLIIRNAPYGTANVGEGLRAAIALAGMDMDTTVVLMDDAVFAALKGQEAEAIGMNSLGEVIESAKKYGAKPYVHSESLQQRSIDKDDLINVEIIDTVSVANLIHEADATITF